MSKTIAYPFYTCDVFTDTRFGGNQLAVLPDARGLTAEQMQLIAREFNFAESTFVLPAEQGGTRRVRIFSKQKEYPFAGHPNVGTAFVLASIGALGDFGSELEITFEELAGLVPITISRRANGMISCELRAPESLVLGPSLPVAQIADCLSLTAADIKTTTHFPQEASVGLPFVIVELVDRAALEKAQSDLSALQRLASRVTRPSLHLYVRSEDQFDIRCRMFAPLGGTAEDSATGSANCALAGLLTHYTPETEGQFSYRIAQGIEMGRPSVLEARAEKKAGQVTAVWIGGECVMISRGEIEV